MLVSEEQSLNAERPTRVTAEGRATAVSREQRLKVCSATAMSPVAAERLISVSAEHPRKAEGPISVTDACSVTRVRFEQPQKAPAPTDVTREEVSNENPVMPIQSLNAPGAMEVTLKALLLTDTGTVTLPVSDPVGPISIAV